MHAETLSLRRFGAIGDKLSLAWDAFVHRRLYGGVTAGIRTQILKVSIPLGSLAHSDGRVDKRCAFEAPGCLAVVVKGVRRSVIAAVPRTSRNAVPPGIPVSDRKAGQSAGDLNRRIRRYRWTLVSARVCVVRPRVSDAPGSLGVRR